MSLKSRNKGKRGEREWAKALRGMGFESAKRGVQYQGGDESPDVACNELGCIHFETKLVKDFDIGTALMAKAIAQAKADAGRKKWVVVWRRHGCRTWLLTFMATSPPLVVVTTEASRELLLYLNEWGSSAL